MGYMYMTNNVMSKGLVFIDEMQVLTYFTGYCLLLGYAIFLILRKKYIENIVLIAGFILFIAVDLSISNYTKKERLSIERQLLEHHN
jgi:hypothetical protein